MTTSDIAQTAFTAGAAVQPRDEKYVPKLCVKAAAGTAIRRGDQPIPRLFQPLKIRGIEFHNRVSSMSQYSAVDGKLGEWHRTHLGALLTHGPGLTIMEGTAILPEGRITPEDAGIWCDDHIPALASIVRLAHSQNQKIAIQLAHAGRKASMLAPWIDLAAMAAVSVGGWPEDVWGPSDVPFDTMYPNPKALTVEGIRRIVEAYAQAARRAVASGFDVIEIHNAHGYLLHSFCSPASNNRTDEYGGHFDNRVRLTLEVVDAIRAVIPESMPLFLRISGTDWLEDSLPNEPSWRCEDTVRLAHVLVDHGVDFLDVSSAGNHPLQRININPGAYQAFLAEAVKHSVGDRLIVGSVGSITDAHVADEVLVDGKADVVLVGRQFLKNPATVWMFAEQLGVDIVHPRQIGWPFIKRDDESKSVG